jgi:hypothetical protein
MLRKTLITFLAILGVLAWSVESSTAQSYWEGASFQVRFDGDNPGAFNVSVQRIGQNDWGLFIQSAGHGLPGQFPNPSPEHNVSRIHFEFYGEKDLKGLLNSAEDTLTGGTNDPLFNNWIHNPDDRWLTARSPDAVDGYQDNIRMDGTNHFEGVFRLQSPSYAKYVSVSLRNGWTVKSGYVSLTPEPASLAMLVPGILPLGLAWRRSRSRKRE